MVDEIKNNWANYRAYKLLSKHGATQLSYAEFSDKIADADSFEDAIASDVSDKQLDAVMEARSKAEAMYDAQLAKGRVLVAPDATIPVSAALNNAVAESALEIGGLKKNLTSEDASELVERLRGVSRVKMSRDAAKDLSGIVPTDENPLKSEAYLFGTSVLDTYGNANFASPTSVRDAGGLAIGLYSTSVQAEAKKTPNSTFVDIVKNRNARVNKVAKTLAQPASKQAKSEALADDSREDNLDNVTNAIGKFMTKNEVAQMRAKLDSVNYSEEALDRGSKLLQHLYDEGHSFDVAVDDSNSKTVSALIKGSTFTRVRILDEDEQWIGRVYQSNVGALYYSMMHDKDRNKVPVKPNDEYALVDFALGRRGGRVSAYAKNGKTMAMIDGVTNVDINRRPLVNMTVRPSQLRQFKDATTAEQSLRDNISLAQEAVRQEYMLKSIVSDGEEKPTAEEMTARREEAQAHAESVIGNYDDGFNPIAVIEAVKRQSENNINNLVVEGLRLTKYDKDKLFIAENKDADAVDDVEVESAVDDVDLGYGSDEESESEVSTDSVVGESFAMTTLQNHLVSIDPKTVKYVRETNADENLTDFQKGVLDYTRDFLKDHGFKGENGDSKNKGLLAGIDDNGIVVWQGYRLRGKMKGDHSWEKVQGTVGQIFEPDEKGVIKTNFASGENYGFVPGYRGYYKYDDISKPASERLRVQGYDQVLYNKLGESLRQQVVRPLLDGVADVTTGMDTNSLNSLYHGDVYGQRVDLDWYDKSPLHDETKDAILDTLSHRVRFDNKLGEFATTFSQNLSDNADETQLGISALVDHKNLRTLDDSLDGVFDKVMTATGKSQGLVRYLVDGTEVDKEGVITPAKDPNAKAKLLELDYFKNFGTNAWDREQMAANQLLDAVGVNENTRVALMNAGGWTYDDGAMISKDFSEKNMVQGHNGELRPLMVGDKISDFGGNKATISIVVDAEMSDEEAKAKNLENEVKLVRDNDLDVVMSSYSVLTRDNAGVVRELQDSEDIRDVKSPIDGQVVAQSGTSNIIITNMLVDEKSHAYDDDALAQGKGRKFSSQLTWATTQLGAEGVMREAFANNDRAWSDMREYLIATGYDMGADGTLQVGYHPQGMEMRNVVDITNEDRSSSDADDVKDNVDQFLQKIGETGGMLKLPFEVTMKSGEKTDEFPILSSSLRRQTELIDGKVREHDYTKAYGDIYKSALKYREVSDDATPDEARDARKNQADIQYKVQEAVDHLQQNIIYDKLGGLHGENSKHSHIRDNIMAKRLPNSATAVITPDPRLDLDKVVVGAEMYKTLYGDVESSNKRAAIFRDPILHAGSVRGVRVEKDTTGEITGMQVNPAIMKSFDGDFDGDSLGIWVPHTKQAQKELKTILSIESNLIDPISDPQNPKIYLNTGMDITAGADKAGMVKVEEGQTTGDAVKSQLSKYASRLNKDQALEAISGFVKGSLSNAWGADGIMLGKPDETPEKRNEQVYSSLAAMVGKGAKGNPGSLDEYKKYHENKATRDMANDIQTASGVKSDDTGVAGANSQKLIALMRDINPEAALEFTYVISQGTLQIKHDAVKAQIVDEALNSKLKNLFNGKPVDSHSKDDVLTKDEFKDSIRSIYENELGVDVRDDHLNAVTDVLADGGKTIKPIKDLMAKKASPMDQIAYGGGLEVIDRLARENRSLAEGKWSSMMAPDKVLQATEESQLVKKDTQDTKAIDSLKDLIADSFDKVAPKSKFALPEDAELSM